MTIIDRARDALKDSTPGPWRLNERSGRTFQSHIIVEPHRGAHTICEMTDVGEYSAELAALAPELATEVVRLHDQLVPLVDELVRDIREFRKRPGADSIDPTRADQVENTTARIRNILESETK